MEDYLQLENGSNIVTVEQPAVETSPNLDGDPIGVYDPIEKRMVFKLCDWEYSIPWEE